MDLIKYVEQSQMRTDLPAMEIGDLLKIHLKVTEGTRERIQKIEKVRSGKVRRAKLYYLRDRVGKAARIKER